MKGLHIEKNSYLVNTIYCLFIFFSVNFFSTSNPYMAYHSGRTAYGSQYQSDHFFFNPAYLLLVVLMLSTLILIITKKYHVSTVGLFFSIICFFVSILNNSIYNNYISVIYNSIAVLIVSDIALSVCKNSSLLPQKQEEYKKLYNVIVLLLSIGALAALLFRDRYGEVNFDFSRKSRGEITFWLVLGLHIWTTVIALTMFHYKKKVSYLVPIFVVALFQLAFSNRMALIVIVMPVLFYIVFLTNSNKKIIIFSVLIAALILNYDKILFFITGGNRLDDSTSILNGREALWDFYYNSLKEHPFVGAGVNLSESSDYRGGAYSEIGVLKLFGEYGLFVGIFQLVVLIIALIKAVRILRLAKKAEKSNPIDLVMTLFYISCFIPFILESHSRILNMTDFFAWLSLYYILHKNIPYSNFSEEK